MKVQYELFDIKADNFAQKKLSAFVFHFIEYQILKILK